MRALTWLGADAASYQQYYELKSDDPGDIFKGAEYAIFRDAVYGRIHLIQHDGNETFRDPQTWGPLEGQGNANRPIISRLFEIPHLRGARPTGRAASPSGQRVTPPAPPH